ncbi:probable calcium-binding protein CML29 [Manihot esculenta]|uniref:EF-hand domain-containing protein n=1 Tax=Manihot esculenta TaxID=3983 RepID=A0A2C9WGZ8_MANES|nr:probable calcium-binding protein CML29 [Manihot esculenta]OAY58220.1 hypothetical protein MANES_02G159200v8 [Manihot esculenta]
MTRSSMAQSESLSAEIETLSQVSSLMEAFRAFDSDNDGFITEAELGGILGSLGYKASQQDVMAMMQQGDANKDGLLSIKEFLDMNTKDMELGELANSLKTAFEALNADGGEVVTAEELYELARDIGLELPMEDWENIVGCMDVNGDGAVSRQDFNLIVNSLI